jgi:hypothetical protein
MRRRVLEPRPRPVGEEMVTEEMLSAMREPGMPTVRMGSKGLGRLPFIEVIRPAAFLDHLAISRASTMLSRSDRTSKDGSVASPTP